MNYSIIFTEIIFFQKLQYDVKILCPCHLDSYPETHSSNILNWYYAKIPKCICILQAFHFSTQINIVDNSPSRIETFYLKQDVMRFIYNSVMFR